MASRTSLYKAWYFGSMILVAALSLCIVFFFHLTILGVALLALALLLPGRILGFFWRDLLRGLRFLQEKRYVESRRHSELFLAKVRERPWLKKLIWLGSGAYSRDPEAMALNNLGAAELKLGELENARAHLHASIAVDSLNPLPHFNLGIVHNALGDPEAAAHYFDKAVALGFSRNVVDKIVMASQRRFAQDEGRGHS